MPSIFGAMASLSSLQLHSNQLTGALPDLSATALATLELNDNLLSGTLPASLSALAATLSTLYVALCACVLRTATLVTVGAAHTASSPRDPPRDLSSNQLSGTLPSQWSSLTAVTVLDLSANQLGGSVPVGWMALPAVQELRLNHNNLNGSLPACANPSQCLPAVRFM